MADMEKVIEALQYMISEDCTETQFDYTDDIESAIAMLKEQEAQKLLVDEKGKITPLPIVLPNCPLKKQEAVEPFHKCTGEEYTLIEDSHFDYCPYCGKPITWESR